jgi:exodeoxyribonuclease V alpha subunit
MRSGSEPSTQEVLAGLVERVTFHNAENGIGGLRAKARFGMISNPRRRGGS